MTEQLVEIGQRLRALREIIGLSEEQMAAQCGLDVKALQEYERGERDFSFSFLYSAANILGVDVVDLMSGDSPKLSICSMVKDGEGYEIERRKAYNYKHLAYTFRNKKAEPFMVEVEPKDIGEKPVQHAHEGQEFNYVVEGRMEFFLGDIVYILEAGDSVYFDSGVPHAMKALGGKKTRFIAVVIK
ncbi:MAG: helix-turn-helix domain-containing protein [Bacillota bacterium]